MWRAAVTAGIIILALILAFLFGLLFNPRPPPALLPPPSELAAEPAACSTTGFMRPVDFDGTWQRVSRPAPSGAMSTFNGRIVFANVDSTIVDDVLPSTWTLAKPLTPQSCHPILMLFGHQTELQVFGSILVPFVPTIDPSLEYSEMMLLVPFVQNTAAGKKMHTFVKHMFVNDMQALTNGNYYAYAKELGDFTETTANFSVNPSMITNVAFGATASSTGAWQVFGTGTVPGLDEIREILEMPLVGVKWNGLSWNDTCSYFELDYAAKPASIQPIQVNAQYFTSYATGMGLWPTLGGIANAPNGAVEVKSLVWKIRFPPTYYCTYN